jgi:hypothetical protein
MRLKGNTESESHLPLFGLRARDLRVATQSIHSSIRVQPQIGKIRAWVAEVGALAVLNASVGN